MFRDEDQFPQYTNTVMEVSGEVVTEHEQRYANDDFDDVFGSAPPSPTFSHDEIYTRHNDRIHSGNLEPSDIPRLKEKHETEGYRDGVTKGKAESVQKGFDEGYSLGAILGLKIGKILGLLEGIYWGLKGAGTGYSMEVGKAEKLLGQAKEELGTKSVFGTEWWGEDGVWKFEVPGEQDGKEVLFPDVAAAHPLVIKWEKVIEEKVKRWELNLEIMEGEHDEDHVDEEKSTQGPSKTNQTAEVTENNEALARIMGVAKKDLNW